MARYIDADKLSEMIQAKADTLIEGKEAFLYVAKWLELLHTADVVSKSEVEELIKSVDDMLALVCALTGLELTYYGKYAELKKKYTEGDDGNRK